METKKDHKVQVVLKYKLIMHCAKTSQANPAMHNCFIFHSFNPSLFNGHTCALFVQLFLGSLSYATSFFNVKDTSQMPGFL